ncbi:MAG: hypothetical protein KDE47_29215, partial [Caldilineaceae bacterium]|nr:hypothetical protein [Caldilineaceae bacterium]
HHVMVIHITRGVIITVNCQHPAVAIIRNMQGLKITWVVREDCLTAALDVGKMDVILRPNKRWIDFSGNLQLMAGFH